MRKHLSVFMLMVRSSLYPILGLFLLMAATQGGVFWYVLNRGHVEEDFGLEYLVSRSGLDLIFGLFFFLVCFFLMRTGHGSGSKQGYTLMRLRISERWVFFWQCVYNCLMFVLFWLAECLIVLGLCQLYAHCVSESYLTSQTLFLAFYRSEFLHSLLPMEDTLVWVRNIILGLCLGICAARAPMGARQGHRFPEIVALACIVAASFTQELGNGALHVIISLGALCFAAYSLYKVLLPEKEVEDDG